MDKSTLLQELNRAFNTAASCALAGEEAAFFAKPEGKWSAAENMEHLVLSVRPLNLLFSFPLFLLRVMGKPNRPSRSFEELKTKYYAKLAAGGRATAAFVPKPIRTTGHREALIRRFEQTNTAFLKKVERIQEADWDHYLIPHPLLGKLSIREMLYFTVFHTDHHRNSIVALKGIEP